ncbi:unnamed protein product [Strongylus vulgaris]|uniref:Uncharacterized protein n=1 Tax=Strongylus vulgaris TaxID=40348 RepID=A0A3P7JA88_STRVU|nr:unnamed protein product [Strongylus vulgaris]
MCFVAHDTLREQGNFLSVLIPPRPDFEVFNFAGFSEERDEIVMELDIEDFERNVIGGHSYLKMKLRQKANQKPFLQVELRDRGTRHELPVRLIKTAQWSMFRRPDVPRGVTLKVNNNGEMHLRCRMDQAEVTVYFSDLANDTITGRSLRAIPRALVHCTPIPESGSYVLL